MAREVRKATADDLMTAWRLIEVGKQTMRLSGNNNQWNEGHPSLEQIRNDIKHGVSYLLLEDGEPITTWAFIAGPDPTYAKIYGGEWLDDSLPYHVIHRVAGLTGHKDKLRDVLTWCFAHADNIRVDTHKDNAAMIGALEHAGFHRCGIIHLLNGDERIAFQRLA